MREQLLIWKASEKSEIVSFVALVALVSIVSVGLPCELVHNKERVQG